MTTAHNQAVPIRLAVLVAAMLLAGCRDSATTYGIEGAQGHFCVPRSVDATPARPNSGKLVGGGFTLSGCWNAGSEACKGPENLVSMAVVRQKDFGGRRFVDFESDAHIKEVAVNEVAHARMLSGEMLAIPDGVGSSTWFIWRMDDQPHTIVRGSDELMATCEALREYRGFSCHRRMLGPDYTVIYSYFVSGSLPTSFEPLDGQVLSEVEALRCKQKP